MVGHFVTVPLNGVHMLSELQFCVCHSFDVAGVYYTSITENHDGSLCISAVHQVSVIWNSHMSSSRGLGRGEPSPYFLICTVSENFLDGRIAMPNSEDDEIELLYTRRRGSNEVFMIKNNNIHMFECICVCSHLILRMIVWTEAILIFIMWKK